MLTMSGREDKVPHGFEHPRVGVGVMLMRPGRNVPIEILLGRRKGSHAAGEYAFPGGHLENGESLERCAIREVRQETGLEVVGVKHCFTAMIGEYASLGMHYVMLGASAWVLGEDAMPRAMEPDKCDGWGWYDPFDRRSLPWPIMGPSALALHEYAVHELFYDLEAARRAIAGFREILASSRAT